MVSCLHCWNNSIRTALGTVEPPSSSAGEARARAPRRHLYAAAAARSHLAGNMGARLPLPAGGVATWDPSREHLSCFWAFWKASKSRYLLQLSFVLRILSKGLIFFFFPSWRSFEYFSLLCFFNPTTSSHGLTFLWLVLTWDWKWIYTYIYANIHLYKYLYI